MRPSLLVLFAFTFAPLLTAAPERWQADIDAFTTADAANPPPRDGIVFVGSSSIRRWTTLAADFRGLPVLNRGFGGSELADSVFYAERIVMPYHPRTIVLYAGENDLNAGKSPETVRADFQAFRTKIHATLPRTRIIYIGMKPSPSRWAKREAFVLGNELIAAECRRDPRLAFMDTWYPMLNDKGEPRRELFGPDLLHMNEQGYAIWTKALAPLLR